jgi:hypothetical protein
MKVKIGDKIYSSNDQPIMIILTEYNKKDIRNMNEDAYKYCEYPDTMSEEEAREFMKTSVCNENVENFEVVKGKE